MILDIEFKLVTEVLKPACTNAKGTQISKIVHICIIMKNYCLGNQSPQKDTLSEDGLDLFVSASSLLEHVGLHLKNAEIDVHTLRIVQKNRASFLNLYSLLSEFDGSYTSSHETEASTTTEQRETSPVKLFLDMRTDELEAFEKEREAVCSFVEMCSMIKSGE